MSEDAKGNKAVAAKSRDSIRAFSDPAHLVDRVDDAAGRRAAAALLDLRVLELQQLRRFSLRRANLDVHR